METIVLVVRFLVTVITAGLGAWGKGWFVADWNGWTFGSILLSWRQERREAAPQ